MKLFKTTVLGVGPFCVEFPDGEIIHTRSEARQKAIAQAFAATPQGAPASPVGADGSEERPRSFVKNGIRHYPASEGQKPYGIILKELAGLLTAYRSDKQSDADVQPSEPVRSAVAHIRQAADELVKMIPVIDAAALSAQPATPAPQETEAATGKADEMAWQPIETAPSDVDVLLFIPQRHETNPQRIESRVYHNSRAGTRHAWATHWMPLPAPPALSTPETTPPTPEAK